MTAQISDTVLYKNKSFCLTGINGEGLFNPANCGIKPVIKSTGCYRGFRCEYFVNEDYLKLHKVHIGLDYKNFLLIKYDRGGQKLFGELPDKYPDMFGLHQYDGQNKIIEFTGGLLIGTDYIRGLGSNAGSPPPYIFKQAIAI